MAPAILAGVIEVDPMRDMFDGSHSIIARLQFLNKLLDKGGLT
jgi:hypothetical protein